MPPQSRAQRRRQSAREQRAPQGRAARRPAPLGEQFDDDASAELSAPSVDQLEAPYVESPAPARSAGGSRVAAARTQRRSRSRAPEPVDYTADYASARRDLRLIAIWAVLLFIGMIALRLSGVVQI